MKYLFDLDGTLTKQETLPLIAKKFNIAKNIEELTANTIAGGTPFQESFIKRVEILKDLPVDEIASALGKVELFEGLIEFIAINKDDCIVITGNLEPWIKILVDRVGCKFYSSKASVVNNYIERLISIQKKEEVVSALKEQGEEVTYIGDGNNDAEAMRLADISIACGLVHYPARSVLDVADYLVFEESALLRLLNQIKSPQKGQSLVVPAAGVGSRLGLGKTKALLDLNGKKLIHHHLDNFNGIEDVRVVIGFEYAELISAAMQKRRDIIFVFNHDYFHTKTCASLYLGSQHANEMILGWDGDLLVSPDDLYKCLNAKDEFLGCSEIYTDDGIFVDIEDENVVNFTHSKTKFEWSGPFLLNKNRINNEDGNVFEMLSKQLPLPAVKISAMDIDTYGDYERACKHHDFWSLGNSNISTYYKNMAKKISNPLETRNNSPDFSSYDINFVMNFSNPNFRLLDLGAGTGLLINNLIDYFEKIIAIEKYPEFSKFICKSEKIELINLDILDYMPNQQFDVVTAFGVMNFFSAEEARIIYDKVFKSVLTGGTFIVKNQMGINGDVIFNGYSEELGCQYFSQYRHLDREIRLLEQAGFVVKERVDIYPEEFNRWSDTHFYALVCSK